jgi:hypothetical protein
MLLIYWYFISKRYKGTRKREKDYHCWARTRTVGKSNKDTYIDHSYDLHREVHFKKRNPDS